LLRPYLQAMANKGKALGGQRPPSRRQPPNPALVRVIRQGDEAVAGALLRASQRLKRLIPKTLPRWGTPEAEVLRQSVRAITARMYVELAEAIVRQAQTALDAGFADANAEVAGWLRRDAFAEFEVETLEELAALDGRAARQVEGLREALGRII